MTPEYLDAAVWRASVSVGGQVFELVGADGAPLAYVHQRNRYCDRGHWRAHIVAPVPNLDSQDEWPRYFMRSDRAMDEVADFLKWRLCGVRAEETPPTFLDELLGEREVKKDVDDHQAAAEGDRSRPAEAPGRASDG